MPAPRLYSRPVAPPILIRRQSALNMRGACTNRPLNKTGQMPLVSGIVATSWQVVQLCLVLAGVCHSAACVGVVGKTDPTDCWDHYHRVCNVGSKAAAEITPRSVNYGNVAVGSSAKQAFNLANTGTVGIAVTSVRVTGSGFSVIGIPVSLSLPAGTSTSFTAVFTPTSAGSDTGALTITTNPDVSLPAIGLLARGTASQVDVTPSVVSFGNVVVGSSAIQAMQLKNSGTSSLTVSAASTSGSGFSVSGLSLPSTLPPGGSVSFTAGFAPTTTGNQTGTISIASNSPSSPLQVAMTGTGVAATITLASSATSLSFGSVTIGGTSSQVVKLTSTGNSNVDVSKVAVRGTGFTVSDGSGVNLTPNQSTNVTVSFSPRSAGSVTGTLSVVSNASNSPLQIGLSGNGVAQTAEHSVSLSWSPSSSTVIGYFVYRSAGSNVSFSRLNATPDTSMAYTDDTVSNGVTYYYAVTAVDSNDVESTLSNQVSVQIP